MLSIHLEEVLEFLQLCIAIVLSYLLEQFVNVDIDHLHQLFGLVYQSILQNQFCTEL